MMAAILLACAFPLATALWRWSDGRGVRYSEAAGWALGLVWGFVTFRLVGNIWMGGLGALFGAGCIWCAQAGYPGWTQIDRMLHRASTPAFAMCQVGGWMGMIFDPLLGLLMVLFPAWAWAASPLQVPLRHWQEKGPAGRVRLVEALEGFWVGVPIPAVVISYWGIRATAS